jgi:hypothetical protein
MREHLAAASAAAAAAAGGEGGEGGDLGAISATGSGAGGVGGGGTAGAGAFALTPPLTPLSPTRLAAAKQRWAEAEAGLLFEPSAYRHLTGRQREQEQALLLRWVEEQEGGAYEALEAAKASLLALKAVARKRQQKHSATRLLLQVDRVVWQMCSISREPLLQASILRLTLDKLKNRDHSGALCAYCALCCGILCAARLAVLCQPASQVGLWPACDICCACPWHCLLLHVLPTLYCRLCQVCDPPH